MGSNGETVFRLKGERVFEVGYFHPRILVLPTYLSASRTVDNFVGFEDVEGFQAVEFGKRGFEHEDGEDSPERGVLRVASGGAFEHLDEVERVGSSEADRDFAKGIEGLTAILAESFESFTSFQDGVEGAAGVSNCMPVGVAACNHRAFWSQTSAIPVRIRCE